VNLFPNLPIGHHRLACPECARTKTRQRDTALSVDVGSDGSGVYLCHRCGWRGGWRAERSYARPGAVQAPRPRSTQHLSLAASWRDLWRSLSSIVPGMTAHAYLTARGCAIPPADGDLRCAELLPHPSGYTGPALVALVSHAETGEPMTLHRTWIRADGTKAAVTPPRLLLGQHRKQGGVIRLWPDEAVTAGLAVTEGIETALAVATVFRPVWSAIDAGNLAALPVLSGIEKLLVVADHDEAGLRAARECAKRWRQSGRRVRIAIPPRPGTDACDMARAA
jgi:putative DNA primase/helicase